MVRAVDKSFPRVETCRVARDPQSAARCGSLAPLGMTIYEKVRSRNYNLAHVISPVPHALVACGLARRRDFSRVRRSAHRLFTRTPPDPPHGGGGRRALARFAALHGH